MSHPRPVKPSRPDKTPIRVPPIVHTVRQHAKRHLGELNQKLFNSTDDALFELADRSVSNTEQTLFFESMRQIRLRRKDVSERYARALYQGFDALFDPSNRGGQSALDDDADSLSLVANDDLEITVAVAGIVSKISSSHSLLLLQLTKRLDHVCKLQSVTERSNPLGPHRLSMAFVEACECLDLDIKVRIILLKLFERMVMENLGDLYELANQLMIEAGVLPELRSLRKPAARPGTPRTPNGGDPGAVVSLHPESYGGSPADLIPGTGMPPGAGPPPGAGGGAPAIMQGGSQGGAQGAGYPAGAGAIAGAAGGPVGGAPASFGVMQQLLAGARRSAGGQAGNHFGSGGFILGPGGTYLPSSAQSGVGAAMQDGPQGSHPGVSQGSGQAGGGAAFGADGVPLLSDQLAAGGDSPVFYGGSGRSGIAMSTPELVGLLSQIQDSVDEQRIDPAQPVPLLDLKSMVFNQADEFFEGEEKDLEQNDDDVINIVGMLFDFILNDRNLAIPMKALISRLQIPFVKLAILDKAFFEHSSHPARQLLNELSSAGIGWSSAAELKRDTLYNKIEAIVLRVLNGFTDDPNLFEELVSDLRAFLTEDNKRHLQVEARVQQSESGKAKTQAIRGQVQQLINQKASGLRLPAQIGRFISDSFARALVMTGVKHGEDSGDWHVQLQTLDDLLWCCQPLAIETDMDQRDALMPELLARLNPIIDSVQEDPSAAEELRFNIECELQDAAARDRAYLGEDTAEPALPEEYAPVAEIRLTEVTPDSEIEAQAAPQFVEQLRELNEGGWVELRQDPDKPALRCKLSTIVQPGDRYIFVNRRGMKVADYGRMELARQLEGKALTLLDESEVFDRALQAVVGNLRQMQSKSSRKNDGGAPSNA